MATNYDGDLISHLPSISLIFTLLAAGPLLFIVTITIRNIFFHPLHSYPGPLLWSMSTLPRDYYIWRGSLAIKVASLHKQYGQTIRIAPNELAYTTAQAWKDIFAYHPGKEEFPKDPRKVQRPPNGIRNILGAERENHARYRRLLSHSFSEKGMREQEGLIKQYVDLFID